MTSRTQKDLFEAAGRGELDEVKAIVRGHPDWVGAKDPERGRRTPLMCAAWSGRMPIVEWLAAHGADVNAKDNENDTALTLASYNGHLPVVEWLAAHGADVNAKDNENNTALILAARDGHLPVVECLVAHGADVNAKSNNGYTAVILAALYGHLPVVEWLAAHGANVNAKNDDGDTAIVIAARHCRLPVVECLVAHGADGSTEDPEARKVIAEVGRKHNFTVALNERVALFDTLAASPVCFLNPHHGYTNRDINSMVSVLVAQWLTEEEFQQWTADKKKTEAESRSVQAAKHENC